MATNRTLTVSLLLGLVVMLLSSGCVSFGNATLRDDTALEQIEVGTATKKDVQNVFGDPSERRSIQLGTSTYEWWGYSYSRSVINPLEYLLLVGFFVNGIGTPDTRRDLQVFFDPDGTVRSVRDQKTDYDLGILREDRVSSTIRTVTFLRRGRVFRYEDRVGLTNR
jgi:outer membrane protein assembly factor BamE (lipoprotein component of BamABCDE complex)